jgi:hypothetical protein
MPDGFSVHIKTMTTQVSNVMFMNELIQVQVQVNEGTESGISLPAHTAHTVDGMIVREMTARCMYDQNMLLDLLDLCVTGTSKRKLSSTERAENTRLARSLWDHYLVCGFLSARILQYLNEDTLDLVRSTAVHDLIKSLPEKPFEVLTIHDAFRCLPSYGNDLRKTYNQILYELSCSNILVYLASQIVGHPVTMVPKTFDHSKILEATYSLS